MILEPVCHPGETHSLFWPACRRREPSLCSNKLPAQARSPSRRALCGAVRVDGRRRGQRAGGVATETDVLRGACTSNIVHQSSKGRPNGRPFCYRNLSASTDDRTAFFRYAIFRRILFLEGAPVVSKLNPIKIGQTVLEIVSNDQDDELGAIRAYNSAIGIAHEVADQATADLLLEILKMEEGHVDWAEIQRTQIAQMGIENYLTNQTGSAAG